MQGGQVDFDDKSAELSAKYVHYTNDTFERHNGIIRCKINCTSKCWTGSKLEFSICLIQQEGEILRNWSRLNKLCWRLSLFKTTPYALFYIKTLGIFINTICRGFDLFFFLLSSVPDFPREGFLDPTSNMWGKNIIRGTFLWCLDN